ncbi:MAG: alkaline phosphatase family protein [Myxococcota bacterium]|nr:alkaline phosphatase family protein [Myxococcota bacterium]
MRRRLHAGSLLWLLASILACASEGVRSGGSDAGAALPDSQPGRVPERVVLISVAGLQPADYGVRDGALSLRSVLMPHLAELARRGAYAEAVEPVLPAAPYPVHATLVTGLHPERHGLLGDEVLGRQGLDVSGIASAMRIRGIPLWRSVEAAGLPVASLNWPSTRGADITLLLPDLGVPRNGPDQRWLEDLQGEATPWVVERLSRLDERLPELHGPTTAERDSLVEGLACEIAKQPQTPALWLLSFEQSGTAISRFGPGSEGAREGLAGVDARIGRLLDCFEDAGIRDSTAWIVVGDRSFFPLHTVVYPNVALERVGLITPSSVRGSGIARWQAYVRSYGGAAVVYAETESDALLARRALEEQAERTGAFRVIPASQLESLHGDPNAWFGLQGELGYGIGKSARGLLLQATQRRGLGGYLPTQSGSAVGFVAWGSGVRPGLRVPSLSQVDVAPTAAQLLGVELPGADGRPQRGILGP